MERHRKHKWASWRYIRVVSFSWRQKKILIFLIHSILWREYTEFWVNLWIKYIIIHPSCFTSVNYKKLVQNCDISWNIYIVIYPWTWGMVIESKRTGNSVFPGKDCKIWIKQMLKASVSFKKNTQITPDRPKLYKRTPKTSVSDLNSPTQKKQRPLL